MTYHSPGSVRSSSRRAATASTGAAGFGLFLVGGLVVGRFLSGLVLVGLDCLGGVLVGLLRLDVHGCLLGGLARGEVGGLGLVRVHGVSSLNDVELVLGGLEGASLGLDGVVQVRVRHDGCFFLDTKGGTCERGAGSDAFRVISRRRT